MLAKRSAITDRAAARARRDGRLRGRGPPSRASRPTASSSFLTRCRPPRLWWSAHSSEVLRRSGCHTVADVRQVHRRRRCDVRWCCGGRAPAQLSANGRDERRVVPDAPEKSIGPQTFAQDVADLCRGEPSRLAERTTATLRHLGCGGDHCRRSPVPWLPAPSPAPGPWPTPPIPVRWSSVVVELLHGDVPPAGPVRLLGVRITQLVLGEPRRTSSRWRRGAAGRTRSERRTPRGPLLSAAPAAVPPRCWRPSGPGCASGESAPRHAQPR